MIMDDTVKSNLHNEELNIKELHPVIDLDNDPIAFNDWKIKEHKKGGQFKWDPAKVDLFLDNEQRIGGITGKKLRKKIAHIGIFNVNLLDYLLANPSLIPDQWKVDAKGATCFIFFWGTVYYRPSDQGLYVRCLHFNVCRWREDYRSIDYLWLANRLAIIHKV